MRGNHYLGITAFGESHGKAVGVVIEDVKPGVKFPLNAIRQELEKRRPGKTEFTSPRSEPDQLEVISGVFNGYTTGMPICLLVRNVDANSNEYEILKDIFRPGHADYAWFKKFKIYDYRGGGRASGRETIARVAAGAFVKNCLGKIEIDFCSVALGPFSTSYRKNYVRNPLFWPDERTYARVEEWLKNLDGDSAGGILQIVIRNVPPGLGDPVFEKLDANLSKALISIGGVKGIEFGDGFLLGTSCGSAVNDQMDAAGYISNHMGGILGGVSNGEEIVLRLAVKPVPSIRREQITQSRKGEPAKLFLNGRYDTLLIPRLVPVAKAMINLVLADALAYQKLIDGKGLNLTDYREAIDKLDEDLLCLIMRRNQLAKAVGDYKKKRGLVITQPQREEEVLQRLLAIGKEWQISEATIMNIWQALFAESKSKQC